MSAFVQDVQYSIRQLRRNRGFAIIAVLFIGAFAGVALSSIAGGIIDNLPFEVLPTNPADRGNFVCDSRARGVTAALLHAARTAVINPMNSLRSE